LVPVLFGIGSSSGSVNVGTTPFVKLFIGLISFYLRPPVFMSAVGSVYIIIPIALKFVLVFIFFVNTVKRVPEVIVVLFVLALAIIIFDFIFIQIVKADNGLLLWVINTHVNVIRIGFLLLSSVVRGVDP